MAWFCCSCGNFHNTKITQCLRCGHERCENCHTRGRLDMAKRDITEPSCQSSEDILIDYPVLDTSAHYRAYLHHLTALTFPNNLSVEHDWWCCHCLNSFPDGVLKCLWCSHSRCNDCDVVQVLSRAERRDMTEHSCQSADEILVRDASAHGY